MRPHSAALFSICARPARLTACCFCADFHRRCLFALRAALCARIYAFIFCPFSASLLPLKILFICRSCRDGHPIFFSERKWGKRTARGRYRAPFEPPFLRPAANHSLFRAAGRLNGPSGRKPPADGETLEKPGSRAQLFKRFCAKEDACALRLFSPFFSLLAGLVWPFGPQIAGWRGNARKAKGAELSFSSVSVRWGRAGASSLPGKTGAVRGRAPGISRVRARMGADANTERDLPTAGVLTAGAGFLPAAGNRN